jgi:hypothetical protein
MVPKLTIEQERNEKCKDLAVDEYSMPPQI